MYTTRSLLVNAKNIVDEQRATVGGKEKTCFTSWICVLIYFHASVNVSRKGCFFCFFSVNLKQCGCVLNRQQSDCYVGYLQSCPQCYFVCCRGTHKIPLKHLLGNVAIE